jgi:hypothetical protein
MCLLKSDLGILLKAGGFPPEFFWSRYSEESE